MRKHRIWIIGFMGDYVAYLDMEKEEAFRRYKEEFSSFNEVDDWVTFEKNNIKSVEFDDSFGVYDVWDTKS